MRFLENELGAELFRRGARHITLTEAGEVLYRYAVEILELEHVAKEEIGSMRAGQKEISGSALSLRALRMNFTMSSVFSIRTFRKCM